MRALVIETPSKTAVSTVDDPTPGPRDVIVEVDSCGICGTDVHILDGEFPLAPYPLVPGHEFAGRIVALGSAVTEFAEGDAVACDPSLFCGECANCVVGKGNLCLNWNAIGDTVDGAMAQYVRVPVRNCYRLPESVRLDQASLIEPLSCAVHGFDLLPRELGSHYLIYGAGTMGLLMAQLAPLGGAISVSVVDLNAERLSTAAALGASATAASADELADAHPRGWDVVIDCTGAVPAIEDAIRRVKPGGVFQQFGVAAGEAMAKVSPFAVYNNEITIVGSMAVLHSYGRAVELFASGVIDADTMISDRLPLERYDGAIERFRAGAGRKIQVVP
ncbi:zinc-dependent alcohol dehydrogenase family protein [Sciscionella sediminilitoris]|uniref:zinc-dependent alcohol dehydrogenase family protein n=1 Tax=Sciscionella sediminilitoris TaxID=1445613 RepID=UPI0004DF3DC1|nr:zinc-dependent alcohol dehydrogenase family protein [Sciscionella sp. SE31]